MLRLIIGKEILSSLLNLRFVIACVLSFVLIVSSVAVLTESYEDDVRDYGNRVATQNSFIDEFAHLNRITWMSTPTHEPSRFQPLVQGIDREAEQHNFVSNPIPVLFSRLDFLTVVTIIMSLMAVLFSYDAISGEREAGLLRQTLSNPVSRAKLLLAKFIGGNVGLLIPFTIGVLAGLLYMSLSPYVRLGSSEYLGILALVVASGLYIAAFHALGLLFSATSHRSSEALLKSLFSWVLLVLVIPNISPSLASQLYRIPSATKIDQDLRRITSDERDEMIRQRERQLLETEFSDLAPIVSGMNRAQIQAKAKADPSFSNRYAAYSKAWREMVDQVNAEQQEIANKILESFQERSRHQERLATVFASVSPFSDLVILATDLTETGITGDNRWQEEAGRYAEVMSDLAEERYQEQKRLNPAFSVNDYLDLRDRPRFQYHPQALLDRFVLVLPQIALLLFFNLLFLIGAFLGIHRYDVR